MIPIGTPPQGIIMLHSIGSVTFLALFMVGCGGGGGTSGGGTGGASSPPPPPATYTVGGTVSGLAGSGLALAICRQTPWPGGGYPGGPRGPHYVCDSPLQVSANGAFTLGGGYPAMYSGPDFVEATQQPAWPQQCVVGNATINIQNANDTSITVSCADYNEYSYVTNAADNTLSAYTVDVTTGTLAVLGTPIATGTSPSASVQVGRFVFVANEGSNDISAFAVDSTTGALTAVPGSPFAAGTDPKAMALYGSDALYVANAGSSNVSAYSIDEGTGALAPLSPGPSTIATGMSPTSVVVVPGASVVYVANHGGSNDISAFSIDLTPVPGSPFPAGGNPLSLAVGGGGQFLYTANPDATNPSISGFNIDPTSGALSPL